MLNLSTGKGVQMLLPTGQSGWLVAVLVSVGLVVITAFKHRFGNALLKTVVHAVLFGSAGLALWFYAKKTPTSSIVDFIAARAADLALPVAAVLVLFTMLLGNLVAFDNRLANVVATALVFAAMYGGVVVVYAIRTLPIAGNLADFVFL